jgi:hypothetical protein
MHIARVVVEGIPRGTYIRGIGAGTPSPPTTLILLGVMCVEKRYTKLGMVNAIARYVPKQHAYKLLICKHIIWHGYCYSIERAKYCLGYVVYLYSMS